MHLTGMLTTASYYTGIITPLPAHLTLHNALAVSVPACCTELLSCWPAVSLSLLCLCRRFLCCGRSSHILRMLLLLRLSGREAGLLLCCCMNTCQLGGAWLLHNKCSPTQRRPR